MFPFQDPARTNKLFLNSSKQHHRHLHPTPTPTTMSTEVGSPKTTLKHTFGQEPVWSRTQNPYLDPPSRTVRPNYSLSMVTVKYTYMHDLSSVNMPDEKRTLVFTASVALDRPVRLLKDAIQRKWNHPVRQQVLYFRRSDKTTKLNDHDTLQHYGITGGQTLVLKVPPVPLTYVEKRKLEEKEIRDERIRTAHHKKITYTRYGNGSVNCMNT